MNNHQIRAFVAGFVTVLVFVALFLLAPDKTPLLISGLVCCIIGVAVFFGSVVYLASSTKKDYLLKTAFPFVTKGYAVAAILFSLAICSLEQFGVWTMDFKWFLLVQLVFAVLLILRLLMLSSGKEIVEAAGEKVAANYSNWKMLLADVENILAKTAPESRKDVSAVRDAVQYADPMSNPALQPLEQEIRNSIGKLACLVAEKKQEEIAALCVQIQDQIKDRAKRLKALK